MTKTQEEINEEINKQKRIAKLAHELGVRNAQVNELLVDVAKRDGDINIIVYVMPGIDPRKAQLPIQKACVDVFGPDPGNDIDPVFYPKEKTPPVIAGDQRGQFDSFCIVISPPTSKMYSVEGLQEDFTRRLYQHVMDLKMGR